MFDIVSNSKITTALDCPRKFFYEYILKIPFEPPRTMVDGRNLHTAMEHFFNIVDSQIITENHPRSFYEATFLEVLISNLPSNFQLIDRYRRVLSNFSRIEAGMLMNAKKNFNGDMGEVCRHWYPFKREALVESAKLKLRGVIDRVDLLFGKHQGKYVVIDYKTGKAPKPKTVDQPRVIPSKIRRQMAYYKLLADELELLDKSIDYMCVFYPLDSVVIFEQIKSVTLTSAIKARDRALVIANAGETEAEFPPKVGGHCFSRGNYGGCVFFEICRDGWSENMIALLREKAKEKDSSEDEEE